MKLLNRLSLRMRITLLTGGIILMTSLGITAVSMYNASSQFMSLTLLEDSITAIAMTDIQTVAAIAPAVTVTVADPLEESNMIPAIEVLPAPIIAAKKQFDGNSILFLILISVAGTAAAYIVSGRALRPVRELDRSIVRITGQNMGERIAEHDTLDEIGSLARSFNAMLDRLEQSFLRQKRFSANVAHELKTPLATMNAGIQVLHLDEQPTIEDCLETLDTAERNVKRLIEVVDDLFLLTDERAAEYDDEIHAREMFDDIFEELLPLYAEKRLKVVSELKAEVIAGNSTLARRAFFNLLENAMKYSREGGRITVSFGEGTIAVTDEGVGIPDADLDKVFEPFYRVDQSRSRKVGGAGLGLSIVKAICEKHGWTVRAESVPEGGTVMKVELNGILKIPHIP